MMATGSIVIKLSDELPVGVPTLRTESDNQLTIGWRLLTEVHNALVERLPVVQVLRHLLPVLPLQ